MAERGLADRPFDGAVDPVPGGAGVTRPRLSPFLLPTPTTTYFVLLVVLTVGSGAAGYTELFVDRVSITQPCAAAARDVDPARALDVTRSFLACVTAAEQVRGMVVVLAALGLLALLAAVHAIVPSREIRRFGLQPFEPEVYPAVARVIDEAVAEAGLRRRPVFLVETSMSHPWGRAFGGFGRYYVKITRGLAVAESASELAVARAIVRHELAHVVNRDLDLTGLSLVSLRVFATAVAIPVLAITAFRSPAGLADAAWRLAAVAVAILLVRAALLRSREHDADVRASAWAVAARDVPFRPEAFADPPRRWWSVRGLLDSHPPCSLRGRVVGRPDALLRSGVAEAFGTGLVGAVVLGYLARPAGEVVGDDFVGLLLVGLLIGALVAWIVGTGLWRATLRSLVEGSRLPSGIPAGVALAAGLVVGDLVAPQQAMRWVAQAVRFQPVLAGVGMVLIAALLVGYCRWTVGAAAAWLPVARRTSPTRALVGAHTVGAPALGGLLCMTTLAIGFIPSGNPLALVVGFVGPTVFAVVLLPLLAAPVFVLAAGLYGPPRERRVRLDDAGTVRLPGAPIRVGLVLAVTAAGGLVGAAVNVFLLEGLSGRLDGALAMAPPGGAFGVWEQAALLAAGAIALLGFVTFAVTAVAADRLAGGALAAAHGLLAAFLSGSVACVALSAGLIASRCATAGCAPPDLVRMVGVVFLVNGVAAVWAAFFLGPLVGLVAAARRLLTRRPKPRVPGGSPRWVTRLYRVVAAALVLTAAAPIVAWGVWSGTWPPEQPPTDVPVEVRTAGPGPPPDTVALAVACQRRDVVEPVPFVVSSLMIAQLRQGQALLASTDPALRTFGRVVDDGVRGGRQDLATLGSRAAGDYCGIVTGNP